MSDLVLLKAKIQTVAQRSPSIKFFILMTTKDNNYFYDDKSISRFDGVHTINKFAD